jgi:cyclopropane fatty-acyl-phospholipid synthase-like methyltransferase
MTTNELYDQLGNLESRISGKGSYPIHKKLVFAGKQYHDLNDWLLEKINPAKNIRVLDAGCGVGKTLFMLADKFDINGLGISLSPVEINLANAYKKQHHFKNLEFKVASFDEKLTQKFDLIIAVESIKHSDDYKKSIKNLSQHLNPEGEFWIIEDIRSVELNQLLNAKKFKEWWHVPIIFDQSEIEAACSTSNLKPKETFNLTSEMNRSSLLKAKYRWRIWNMMLRITPGKKNKNNIRTFLGGFILDQWYLKGQMSYLVFKLKKS